MKLTCGWLTHGMKSSALRTLCRAIINSTCGSRTAVGVLSLACPRESTQREGPPGGRKRFLRSSGLGRRQFTAPPCTVNWERTPCPLPFGLLPKPCGARSAPYGDPEQPLPRQQNLSWVFCCSCSCCCRSSTTHKYISYIDKIAPKAQTNYLAEMTEHVDRATARSTNHVPQYLAHPYDMLLRHARINRQRQIFRREPFTHRHTSRLIPEISVDLLQVQSERVVKRRRDLR